MKVLFLVAVALCLLLACCAYPLESVIDQQRQARIDAANAGKPVTAGAGDGLGTLAAESAGNRLTLSDKPGVH